MLFAFTQFLIKTRWLMIIIKINQRYATAILDCNQSKGGYAIMIDWRGSRWIWIHLINMRHEVEKDLACHLLTVKTSPCESLSLSEQTHEGMQFGTGLVCPADGNEAVPRDRDRERVPQLLDTFQFPVGSFFSRFERIFRCLFLIQTCSGFLGLRKIPVVWLGMAGMIRNLIVFT